MTAAMKVSGTASNAKIPEHWRVGKFWTIASQFSRSGHPDVGLMSVYLDRGVIPYSEGGGLVHKPSESLDAYQLVEPGNFVINNQQAWRGSVGVSKHRGLVSPAYLVFELSKDLDPVFANYQFRERRFVDEMMLSSQGVGDIQRQVKWPLLRLANIFLPPLDEQRAIATYLNSATSRIETLIAKKTHFIELLREKRQAVIAHAVNRGLNPNVPMKEIGVEWLRSIPETWDTAPLKNFLQLRRDIVGAASANTKLLSLTLQGVIERDLENPTGKMPASFDSYQRISTGEMVFCLFDIDETPRTVGVAPLDGMVTGAYAVFRPQHELWARYLYYFFLHVDDSKRLKPFYKGLRKTIRPGAFLSIQVPRPTESDAMAIVAHLDRITTRIDKLIAKTERSIELLREYRNALINAAVTGKIDLRPAR